MRPINRHLNLCSSGDVAQVLSSEGEHAEEAFDLINIGPGSQYVGSVALADETNILLDQCNSIKLHSRSELFDLVLQIELDPDSSIGLGFISVNNKLLSACLVHLSDFDLANVHDTGSIQVVTEDYVSLAFAESLSLASFAIYLKNSWVLRGPHNLLRGN